MQDSLEVARKRVETEEAWERTVEEEEEEEEAEEEGGGEVNGSSIRDRNAHSGINNRYGSQEGSKGHWGSCATNVDGAKVASGEEAVVYDEMAADLVDIVKERWMRGLDEDFDYTGVDDDSQYDDLTVIGMDSEERYFDESDDTNYP